MNAFCKRKSMRWLSAFLAIVMLIAMLPTAAFAWSAEEGTRCTSTFGDLYLGSDGKNFYNKTGNILFYNDDGSTYITSHTGGHAKYKYLMSDSAGTHHVYCIEAGAAYDYYDDYGSTSGSNSRYFQNLPMTAQYGIMLALMYGWHEGMASPVSGTNADDFAYATQVIIWEYQQQLRTSPTSLESNNGIDADLYNFTLKGRPAEKCYNWILEKMATHYTVPSFASRSRNSAQTYTLKYNASADNYSLTLTDTNNTFEDIDFSASGISVTRSGNQYTFTSKKMIANAMTVSAQKDINLNMGKMLIWGCPGKQTMASGAEDPVYFYFKLDTETTGVGHIVKASEDGKVDGIRFTISGNGVNQTVTTKADGTVDIDLMPGEYAVTELTDEKYEPQTEQHITIVSGKTSTVTFQNTLKRGTLKVTKTCEDGLVEGIKFRVSGTSLSGLAVDEYAVTDSSGVAVFNNLLIGSNYVLEEVDTPIRYVVPEDQTAAVEWNKVTEKAFDNRLKKFNVTVVKTDAETGTAQGDATLAGAVYGLYKDGQLIDTYTTDQDGQFTTAYYVCGSDWSIREITASEGYLVNETVYPVGADAKLYTVEYNAAPDVDADESVMKGIIAIIKHCDDGETKIETPEEGAEFAVFLKSAGSYENAKSAERDYLVCDEDGFAETKTLPYGRYTVQQTKGWDGKELMPAFDVFVNRDDEVYRYLINNAPFKSYVKVVKTDAETGKAIPYDGAAFHILDPNGNKVEMTFTYPQLTVIDTFYTTADGTLITPEELDYGKGYALVEVSAPYGYVLNSDPVYFDITEDNASEEDAVTVVKVERPNMPQKGTITISKSGEVFASVTEANGIYQPVYEVRGLSGAEYSVVATEDIYTPDGTLRYAKDTVVATLTTDENGTATTEPLYLGRYAIREVKAPYGMILNTDVQEVELSYAGQEVEITTTASSFYNERQHLTIDLAKAMEKDTRFHIGENGEIHAVTFGLYAAEECKAADGTVIPANGLVEIVSCSDNGKAVFKTDLPAGAKTYVKEISTDSHYILSDKEYPVVFEYAGQDTAEISISVNDGNTIPNKLIYGSVKGYKVDREDEKPVAGAKFGLFAAGEAVFSADTAILVTESGEDGSFAFDRIPYGEYVVYELQPAEGYLENSTKYPVTIKENGTTVTIKAVNDRIPSLKTTAMVDGEKEVCATEKFTLTDVVEYQHLIPGQEYTVKGVLMDKSTGKAFLESGKEITAEVSFVPERANGSVIVNFTFDSRLIGKDTDIVVFESLYAGGKEFAVHADLEDKDQTVTVRVPEIKTKATANGKKTVAPSGKVTIEDTVSYTNLTVGKEYTVKGTLMNKATGEPYTVNGTAVTAEAVFTPKTKDGEVKVTFTFDASGITMNTKLVVFETVFREGAAIAVHADINDDGQTVTVAPPTPDVPQTGDESNLGFWIGLGSIALGGMIAVVIIYFKKKKDDDQQ